MYFDMDGILEEEKNLLFLYNKPVETPYDGRFSSTLIEGAFPDIIKAYVCDINLKQNFDHSDVLKIVKTVQTLVYKSADNIDTLEEYNSLDLLTVGIACLYYFIQCNWTGPFPKKKQDLILELLLENSICESEWKEVNKCVTDCLCSDEATISSCCEQSMSLIVAECIFMSSLNLKSRRWWLMRCLSVRQSLLSEPSPDIYYQLIEIVNSLVNSQHDMKECDVAALIYLEAIQIHLNLYSDITRATSLLEPVNHLLHLNASLVGSLGKRTHHQQRHVAQLTLKVETDETSEILNSFGSSIDPTDFPKCVTLKDDVQLPSIVFDDGEVSFPKMNALQHCLLIAMFALRMKSRPKDNFIVEELSPYLSCLLSQPKVWAVHTTALLRRSRLEAEGSRTIDRSISQLQSLISDMETSTPSGVQRLSLIFCSYMEPKWKVEVDLGKMLMETGAIQSALAIFQKYQMWEEIVECYNSLKLRHKAAEVIKEELKKQETVQLWYLLGDATDNEECYRKAWLLSGERSGKVQKHWGLFHFQRKRYAESIPHLEKSLHINSLQIPLWFNLGFAAMDQANWKLSATAFRRYTTLEPDSFEAWNNLAKAFTNLGQHRQAWSSLQEAVKCNYECWQVWDNLMGASATIGDLFEVIRCYNRLLDLKGRHIDIPILTILVDVIATSSISNNIQNLRKEASELFGRITSKVLNDPYIWLLYGRILSTFNDANHQMRAIDCFSKSISKFSRDPNWNSTTTKSVTVLNTTLDYAKNQLNYCESVPREQAVPRLNSAKLLVKGILTKIKKNYLTEEIEQTCRDLEDYFAQIETKLQ